MHHAGVSLYLFLLFRTSLCPRHAGGGAGWRLRGHHGHRDGVLPQFGPRRADLPGLRNWSGVAPAAVPMGAAVAGAHAAGVLRCAGGVVAGGAARARRGTDLTRQQIKWLPGPGAWWRWPGVRGGAVADPWDAGPGSPPARRSSPCWRCRAAVKMIAVLSRYRLCFLLDRGHLPDAGLRDRLHRRAGRGLRRRLVLLAILVVERARRRWRWPRPRWPRRRCSARCGGGCGAAVDHLDDRRTRPTPKPGRGRVRGPAAGGRGRPGRGPQRPHRRGAGGPGTRPTSRVCTSQRD